MPWSREIGRVLLAATAAGSSREEQPTERGPRRLIAPPPASLAGLADAASYHGVTGYLHRAMGAIEGLDAGERDRIEAYRNGLLLGHLHTLSDLKTVDEALRRRGIPYLVVKGPVLSSVVHERPDLRAYGDLDLVVRPEDLPAAVEALAAGGASLLDRNWELLRNERRGQVHLVSATGGMIDLHWALINDRRVRHAFTVPPIADLLARARRVQLGHVEVLTLEPIDTVLHLAVHSMLSGGDRLIWFKDIQQAALRSDIGWQDLVDRSAAWGATLTVGTALLTVQRLFGRVPGQSAMQDLLPSSVWRLIASATLRIAPVERADGRGTLRRIVARSTRPTSVESLRELRRRSIGWAGSLRGRRHSTVQQLPPTHPGSMLRQAGNEADLACYYRDIQADR